MATFLISTLAALGVVVIITMLGLILAQIFINKAEKVQLHTNILSEQPQPVIVDIDQLPEAQQEPGITVISNDVIECTSHRHQHLTKKTVSVIDQDAQLPSHKDRTTSTRTNTNRISSDTSIINPLTDKITLEY